MIRGRWAIIRVKHTTGILIAALLLAGGCESSWYRDAADVQVRDLLRDRQQQTTGYVAPVQVAGDIPRASPRAYQKIPASPIPPATMPIEKQTLELPPVPLGPDPAPPGTSSGLPALDDLETVGQPDAMPPPLGPPLPEDVYLRLDLFGVLQYAFEHSPAYRQQMEDLYLKALDVTLERHLLSPRPFVQQKVQYEGGQASVDYRSALRAATSAGVRQKLPWGGEVVAESLVSFVNALEGASSDGESASVALSAVVPLLRGAGMVNLEALINSERQLVYQVRAFEDFRRSFVINVASQYFRLLSQYQNVVNRQLNVANLAALTERTQALYEAGRISFLEVQRSLQSRLFGESSLLEARSSYQAALDDFKLLIGMPMDQPLQIVPVELHLTATDERVEEAVATAWRYRLDLRTAEDRIDDAARAVRNAENGLLPQLDLTARSAAGNAAGEPASHLDADTLTYSAGMTLDLPVDRVAERNALRRALIEFERARRNCAVLRDRVASEVRESLRMARAALIDVELQRRGIELAQRRLEFSNELLRQGRVQARDVVESQSSLLDAQDRYERARAQLQIRVLEYLRNTGTLRIDPRGGILGRAMTPHGDRSADAGRPQTGGSMPSTSAGRF